MCIVCKKPEQKKFPGGKKERSGASTGVFTATGMFARSVDHSSFKSAPHPLSKGRGEAVGAGLKGEKGASVPSFSLNAGKEKKKSFQKKKMKGSVSP